MAGAAGFGAVYIRNKTTKFIHPIGAIDFSVEWQPTTEDVTATSDCDASLITTRATITRSLDEVITASTQRLTDGTLQWAKQRQMAENTANITYLKTACFTVPTPTTPPTEDVTSATVPNLAGLLSADTTSVTAIFQVAEGVERRATIVGVTPAATDEIQIQDDGVTVHQGNAGQTLLIQFETTGTVTKGIGGPLTTVQSPSITTVEIHGIVELLNGGGKWRYWAPSVSAEGNRSFSVTADATYTLKASTPAGWTDPSFLYQI